MVVWRNFGSVSLVTRNGHAFTRDRTFISHVVIGCTIEVLVGPAKEVLLTVGFVSLVVTDRELGV